MIKPFLPLHHDCLWLYAKPSTILWSTPSLTQYILLFLPLSDQLRFRVLNLNFYRSAELILARNFQSKLFLKKLFQQLNCKLNVNNLSSTKDNSIKIGISALLHENTTSVVETLQQISEEEYEQLYASFVLQQKDDESQPNKSISENQFLNLQKAFYMFWNYPLHSRNFQKTLKTLLDKPTLSCLNSKNLAIFIKTRFHLLQCLNIILKEATKLKKLKCESEKTGHFYSNPMDYQTTPLHTLLQKTPPSFQWQLIAELSGYAYNHTVKSIAAHDSMEEKTLQGSRQDDPLIIFESHFSPQSQLVLNFPKSVLIVLDRNLRNLPSEFYQFVVQCECENVNYDYRITAHHKNIFMYASSNKFLYVIFNWLRHLLDFHEQNSL